MLVTCILKCGYSEWRQLTCKTEVIQIFIQHLYWTLVWIWSNSLYCVMVTKQPALSHIYFYLSINLLKGDNRDLTNCIICYVMQKAYGVDSFEMLSWKGSSIKIWPACTQKMAPFFRVQLVKLCCGVYYLCGLLSIHKPATAKVWSDLSSVKRQDRILQIFIH